MTPFQGHDIFESNIVKMARLKDKVTIAQQETIPSIWNGTTLTDLQTRRAGLSASAELLVFLYHAVAF